MRLKGMSKNDNVVLGIQYGSEERILQEKKKKEGKKMSDRNVLIN